MHCAEFNMLSKNKESFYSIIHLRGYYKDFKKEPMSWREAYEVTKKLMRLHNEFVIVEYGFKEVGRETIDEYW
jgi:hypothetical protein